MRPNARVIRYALFLLVILLVIGHTLYVLKSRQYPQWDEHNYLSLALKYHDLLRSPSLATYANMLEATGYLQPVYSLLIALLMLVLGTSYTYTVALLLNGLFFAGSAAGTYALARQAFDEKTAIVAAVVFAGLGNALFYSHFTYTETAVTTFIIWSTVFLVRSDALRKRRDAVLAGIFCALAVLTRWIAVVFLAGPLLAIVSTAFWQVARSRKRAERIRTLALFFGLAFVLPLLLYFLPNWGEFVAYIARNQQNGAAWVREYRFAEMANTFSTRSVMYYFNILSQNTVYIFLLFLSGVALCVTRIQKTVHLLLGLFVPYAFLTFVAVWKEDRFLVPLYPIFAVITSSVVYFARRPIVKWILAAALVCVSVLTYLGGAWGIGILGKRGLADIVLPSYIHHPRRIYLTSLVWPPTKEYLNAHLIAQIIMTTTSVDRPVVVGAFISEPIDNALRSIASYTSRNFMEYKKPPFDYSAADFVLTKSNDPAGDEFAKGEYGESFRLIANIVIPMDNSTVAVYKHETE